MALITRINRLFTADVNAVIDRLEEPDIVLKQALRDMQDSLAVIQSRMLSLRSQLQQLNEHQATTDQQLSQLDEELSVCLDAGDDDLARNVLRRKLTVEATAKDASLRAGELQRALQTQEHHFEEQSHELESIRQKTELLDAPEFRTGVNPEVLSVSAEQVEIALLAEKQRRLSS